MRQIQWLLVMMAFVFLAACVGAPVTEPGNSTEPDLVGTEVAVRRAAAATLTREAAQIEEEAPTATPSPMLTATPTQIAGETDPPVTATPTQTPTEPPPPTFTPTPTQIVGEADPTDGGGDASLNIHGPRTDVNDGRYVLLTSNEGRGGDPVFRDHLTFRIEVFDETPPGIPFQDGYGIRSVSFRILNEETGETVYTHEETTAPYCVLGGNEPLCPVPSFRQLNYRWPDQEQRPIENAPHRAFITIQPLNGDPVEWNWGFTIAHDGEPIEDEPEDDQEGEQPPPQQPVTRILRPACGNTINVPANAPVTLLHGIWANRGQERAAANAPYIQIDLTIDGQSVPSQRVLPPVETIEGAICGSDYEDSYWVYNVADLDPLPPGSHNVQVTYYFSQPVEDGYGNTYSSPFSQQYTILVQ